MSIDWPAGKKTFIFPFVVNPVLILCPFLFPVVRFFLISLLVFFPFYAINSCLEYHIGGWHYSLVHKVAPSDASILNSCWFVSWLFHFLPSFLLMAWKCSRIWLKWVCSFHLHRGPRRRSCLLASGWPSAGHLNHLKSNAANGSACSLSFPSK